MWNVPLWMTFIHIFLFCWWHHWNSKQPIFLFLAGKDCFCCPFNYSPFGSMLYFLNARLKILFYCSFSRQNSDLPGRRGQRRQGDLLHPRQGAVLQTQRAHPRQRSFAVWKLTSHYFCWQHFGSGKWRLLHVSRLDNSFFFLSLMTGKINLRASCWTVFSG